jgi:hypothetical protein
MAGEIQFTDRTGQNCYVQIRNSVGQIWNGSSFVTYNTANIATYAVTATEQGTASGYYTATMPTVALGTYDVIAKERAGGSPAESDVTVGAGQIEWSGTAVLNAALGADVFFRRTMPNVESSSDGDALNLSSLYGLIQQAQEASVSGGTLTVKKTDGSTTLGTKTVTVSPTADPITGVS